MILNGAPLGLRIHITLITSLTHHGAPFHLDLRVGTNTGEDFANVVRWIVTRGYLTAGDFLVVDGARVHFSNDTREALLAFLNAHQALPLLLSSSLS